MATGKRKGRGLPRSVQGILAGVAAAVACWIWISARRRGRVLETKGSGDCGEYMPQPPEYLRLSSGARMPALGLGTWLSPQGQVRNAVYEAIAAGYRHIDTAWIYKNEAEVGQGIADAINAGLVDRSSLFIVGKLWNTFHKSEDVERGVNETLTNLKLDYLDLYLVHWPISFRSDFAPAKGERAGPDAFVDVPLLDTWRAMEKLVRRGLVRSIGVSNLGPKRLQQLLSSASIPPAVNQIEVHPYLPQTALLKLCRQHSIVVTAYSPLGSPGRDARPAGEPMLIHEHVVAAAASATAVHILAGGGSFAQAATGIDVHNRSVSPGQVLLLWAWHRGVAAIPKSITKSRIQENYRAFKGVISGQWQLPVSEYKSLCALERGLRYVPGHRMLKPGQSVEDMWAERDVAR